MDRNLAMEVVRVTEMAAIASARLMGRGDKNESDQAAVDAMRRAFDALHIDGTIVIGEGERDEAPMLYIGEKVGRRADGDPAVDIALDPLEGTNLCAYGRPGSITVVAMASKGGLLNAPDTYMEKLAVGPRARGAIDLRKSATENLRTIAEKMKVYVSDLTVVVLDRERHQDLIKEIRAAGARIRLIEDGDVAGAIATCFEGTGVDVLMGTGGAPEGVIAAAAIRATGGDMQGRLVPRNPGEIERAKKMGITDMSKIYAAEELARGEVMFAATGVTSGDFLKGVRFFGGGCETHSVVMRSKTSTVRFIQSLHKFDKKPGYASI
ncbi:class II fructose-bisphosphatase [Myxococcus fulvus]|uniref:Fructose-1,6-bisphosphatase n=1 Tax=Myxococcus fulvus TaxID=33 RepID=A0A511T5D8_MYXFU|nr:class II fructose-bisphosphatase [Myxococcus fulvus]AKF82320.1 fructose 1,6-bisphosphatase [Myxococcus fulvus 124B02]GEN09117.1 fructose-bisphosphatase class II [Myxococcus fulvus]SEU15540.1 fructose-1,6-bisphosphatase II [Myxococcus fulvus]